MKINLAFSHNDILRNESASVSWNCSWLPRVGDIIESNTFKDAFPENLSELFDEYIWRVDNITWNKNNEGKIFPALDLAEV